MHKCRSSEGGNVLTIADFLDYINDHKVYRYLYLVAVSYVWIKFKATKLYAMIAIWVFRRSLINHQLFDNMDMLTNQIPSQIKNLGKKHAFTDMLRAESALFIAFLKSFIREICKIEHGQKEYPDWIKFLIVAIFKADPARVEKYETPVFFRKIHELYLYIRDFDYNTETLPRKLLSNYDTFINELNLIFESGHFKNIEINQKQIIKWLRNNRETPVVTKEDSEEVRETLQRRHMRVLIFKYDGIMFDYRVQIKKNLALQITSELNMYDQVKAILKYSFQSVYKAMEISLPRKVNEINGELTGIVYEGFDCGEK
jgi:hypothetical protein